MIFILNICVCKLFCLTIISLKHHSRRMYNSIIILMCKKKLYAYMCVQMSMRSSGYFVKYILRNTFKRFSRWYNEQKHLNDVQILQYTEFYCYITYHNAICASSSLVLRISNIFISRFLSGNVSSLRLWVFSEMLQKFSKKTRILYL